jgi:hypothetical protein
MGSLIAPRSTGRSRNTNWPIKRRRAGGGSCVQIRRRVRADKVWLAIGTLRSLQTEEALRERVEYHQRKAHRLKFRRGRHAWRHRLEPALGQTVAEGRVSGRATMQVTVMFACGRRLRTTTSRPYSGCRGKTTNRCSKHRSDRPGSGLCRSRFFAVNGPSYRLKDKLGSGSLDRRSSD